MYDFKRIKFAYFPAEAGISVVSWYLRGLDQKLAGTDAQLLISDMKFGRGGLEINWDLIGSYSEELESLTEQEIEWICRKVAKTF